MSKRLHSIGGYRSGQRVFIAVPTAGNQIDVDCMFSLFGAKEELVLAGIDSELYIMAENCHVDDGRNICVRKFLEGDCTDLFFVDSDVLFDPKDMVKLLKYDRDVVAGVYPYKQMEEDYPVKFIPGDIWSDQDGLIEVEGVPTGFLRIRRNVLQKLNDESEYCYTEDQESLGRLKVPIIFERIIRGFVFLGGDYEFCRKWRETGGKVYIDPDMRFSHVGTKQYSGSLAAHLRRKNGLMDDHIAILIEKFKKREESPHDYTDIMLSWDNDFTPPAQELFAMLEIARQTDGKILECGSGLSTLLLASTGKPVTSLEQDSSYAENVNKILSKCGIESGVIVTELVDGWYDVDLEEYSMIFIDGPAEKGRIGILKKIKSIPTGCTVIIDDVNQEKHDITKELSEVWHITFRRYGRYAIGRKT
jgi:predicted O-methyltransferase YrrM